MRVGYVETLSMVIATDLTHTTHTHEHSVHTNLES